MSETFDSQPLFQISHTTAGFVGGTFGGLAGVMAGHPFDTIKVRLQSSNQYRGTIHCTTSIVRKEGVMGLFKGMSSPLFGVAVVNSLLFGVYGAFLNGLKEDPADSSTLTHIFIAGSGSGLINSLISCPMELVKIQLQNHTATKETPKRWGLMPVMKGIYQANGIRGYYRGFVSTAFRETPSYGAYFASYEVFCRMLAPADTDPKDISGVRLMAAGAMGGIVGWVITYPFDVVKTVIQADTSIYHKGSKARRTWDTMSGLYKREGYQSLFKGVHATIIRAIPTNIAILSTWHMTMMYFRKLN